MGPETDREIAVDGSRDREIAADGSRDRQGDR
jgi:hypothetical protein